MYDGCKNMFEIELEPAAIRWFDIKQPLFTGDSYMKKILNLIIFIISLILVVKGRTITNYYGLMMMFVGLIGILGDIYLYNKQYQ